MSELPIICVTNTRVLIRWPDDDPDELYTTVVRQPDGSSLLGVTPRKPRDATEMLPATRERVS